MPVVYALINFRHKKALRIVLTLIYNGDYKKLIKWAGLFRLN
jgi:hypothetical protein